MAAPPQSMRATLSGEYMSGGRVPDVPALPHTTEQGLHVFACHHDGHTKMVAFWLLDLAGRNLLLRVDGRAHVNACMALDAASIGATWDSAGMTGVLHGQYRMSEIVIDGQRMSS